MPFGSRLTGWRSHGYVLGFEIRDEDIAKIVASAPFMLLDNLEYRSGELSCEIKGEDRRTLESFVLHRTEEEEPAWLDIKRCIDARAWIAEEEVKGSWYKGHLLIYSKQLGRAYFIERECSGGGVDLWSCQPAS